jgi:putative phosphonate metabolism protein
VRLEAVPRYAIYFAPPPSAALWQIGSGVIGYDADRGEDVAFVTTAGLPAEVWAALTAEPRRYGFHATLKAPFELAHGIDEAVVVAAAADVASNLEAVTLDRLVVSEIGRFIALTPEGPIDALNGLAARIVEELDHLRAPLSAVDRERRLRSPLSPRQLAYLDRYGYPYVREEMRFHMTLTGAVADANERSRIKDELAAALMASGPIEPLRIDALTVFRQDRRDGRFRIIERLALSGPQSS